MAVDPTQDQQSVMVSNFLAILGVALIFATDMHHLAIGALDESYNLFKPGSVLPSGDVAELMISTVSGAFRVGIQLAAPFLVFGILFNVGLGVLARLMPQLQVFFLGLPASIMIGFAIMMALVGVLMGTFLEYLGEVLSHLAPQT
jgi:flagellar biosynthetic protein FliR